MRHNQFNFIRTSIFCVLIFLVFIGAISGCVGELVKNEYQGVLNSTDRVCRGSGNDQVCQYEWRMRGTQGYHDEVFVNMIDVGEEYALVVTGWRIPVLSSFRNVISVQHVARP